MGVHSCFSLTISVIFLFSSVRCRKSRAHQKLKPCSVSQNGPFTHHSFYVRSKFWALILQGPFDPLVRNNHWCLMMTKVDCDFKSEPYDCSLHSTPHLCPGHSWSTGSFGNGQRGAGAIQNIGEKEHC